MSAPVPETDAQVKQRVMQQLLADAIARSGDAGAAMAPDMQQQLDAVRMGSNEDVAWYGGYRNDEVNKSQQTMLDQVATAYQARRDQEAADKALLEASKHGGGGGGGGGGRRSGGGGSSVPLAAPPAVTQPALRGSITATAPMPTYPTTTPPPGATQLFPHAADSLVPWLAPGWETAPKKKAAPPPSSRPVQGRY